MPPALQRIDHIHVFVADRAAAERWYADVLGLRRVPELAVWASDGGPLTLSDPSGSIHLALFESAARPCRSVIAFGVAAADFLAWQQRLSELRGAPVRAVDHRLSWSLYFTDPDANPYEITCYDYDALGAQLRPDPAPANAAAPR